MNDDRNGTVDATVDATSRVGEGLAVTEAGVLAEQDLQSATSRLVRSSALVGVGTALSRVSGMVRVGVLVAVLGRTGGLADTYLIANTSPNVIYDLLLGGILSATLVPVFVDQLERDDDEGASAVVTVTVSVLVALTVAAVLAAPWIFRLYTFSRDDAARVADVGIPLTRLFMPQVLFYGLTALATAVLNARRTFAAPAFAPLLNNVLLCSVLLALPRVAGEPLTLDLVREDTTLLVLLGAGTTAGIVAMTLVLWPALRRAGFRMRWNPDWRHPSVRKVGSLSGWTLCYFATNQVTLVIVTILAGRRDGDWTAYITAFVFFHLPHGLFAVSLMTTFVPDLSAFASRKDLAGYRERFALGLRLLVLVVLPASVGYALLARPLVLSLLQRGQFDSGDAALTGDVLAAFALGLLGFSVNVFTIRGFYALQDTRTPFFLNLVENGLHVLLALALVGIWFAEGLALAFSAAATVAAVASLGVLGRRIGGLGLRDSLPTMVRAAAATAVMAAAVWVVLGLTDGPGGAGPLIRTLLGVVTGSIVYAGATLAFRVPEVTELANRRRSRHQPAR